MTQLLHYSSVRYVLVGILNTLFGYCLFIFLNWLGLNNSIALLCTSVIGIAFSFTTIAHLVFKSNDHQLFYKFILLYVFLYGINLILLESFNYIFHSVYCSAAFSIIFCALISFYVNRHFIFKNRNDNLASIENLTK